MRRPEAAAHVGGGTLLPALAWLLAGAALVELVLLRTASRTALHIPDVSQAQSIYDVGTDFGRYAYFVAVAALVGTLVSLVMRSDSPRSATSFAALVAVAAYGAASVLARTGAVTTTLPIGLSLGAVVTATGLAAAQDRRAGIIAGLAMIAFGATATWNIAQAAAPTDGRWFLWTAEVAIVGLSLVLPLVLRVRLDRVSIAVGAVAGLLLLAYALRNPSTTGILLLWNGGLAGLLPAPFYAAAFAVVVATTLALYRARAGLVVPALIILVCAGATLQNTYQTGLLVAALLLLAYRSHSPLTGPQPSDLVPAHSKHRHAVAVPAN